MKLPKSFLLLILHFALIPSGLHAENTVTLLENSDPFSDLPKPVVVADDIDASSRGFFEDNFTFKKEIFSQFSYGPEKQHHHGHTDDRWYSRQSAGTEILKKFSDQYATYASFNFQGRMVRRDQFIPVINDIEGEDREGWFFEYHNLYFDFYNVLNPLLDDDSSRGQASGHYNFRVGRFYLPFGLNLQTDTHGSLLQLSNERNFGFERDWYAGFWGSLSPYLNYDLYYLLGSGYDASFAGQDGLLGSRVSLSNYYSNRYGIEGGISILAGQRQSEHALERSIQVSSKATNGEFIQTERYGVDGRYSHIALDGTFSFAAELSSGEDENEYIFSQLYQIDYLHKSRKWGLAGQYRRFDQDLSEKSSHSYDDSDSSIISELTWYFRNDIGNANLHWLKINVESQLTRMEGTNATITTLQYYLYW